MKPLIVVRPLPGAITDTGSITPVLSEVEPNAQPIAGLATVLVPDNTESQSANARSHSNDELRAMKNATALEQAKSVANEHPLAMMQPVAQTERPPSRRENNRMTHVGTRRLRELCPRPWGAQTHDQTLHVIHHVIPGNCLSRRWGRPICLGRCVKLIPQECNWCI